MQALEEWKAILTTDLLVLRRLQGGDALSRMRSAMKEQEIGQHCCQAGESLGDSSPYEGIRVIAVSILPGCTMTTNG
jgi:hypothetical protein